MENFQKASRKKKIPKSLNQIQQLVQKRLTKHVKWIDW